MATENLDWSSNANDAVRISFEQPDESQITTLSTFNPKFTYPIFGDEERIFGYKDLDIHLAYAAHDLRPNLEISYKEKFKPVGETLALDLNRTLKEFLPKSAFQARAEFERALKADSAATSYTPPGQLVHSYSRKGKNYEVYAGSLKNPAIKELLDRIQIFILFFIEGGSTLNTEDVEWTMERWTVYFVYEKQSLPSATTTSPYAFVGYATTYRFYSLSSSDKNGQKSAISDTDFPAATTISASDLPSRLRISQFLILPPHQRAGHASELYNTIFEISLADSTVIELTVEDPNEEFDLLRDVNDYIRLLPEFESAKIAINPDPIAPSQKRPPKRTPTALLLPLPTLNAIRQKYKIAPRQFSRLTEMYLLSTLPLSSRMIGNVNMAKLVTQKWRISDVSDRTYYWWRLLLKQRIYKKNRDTLIQLDLEERLSKLDETVRMQEGEFELILRAIADRKDKLKSRRATQKGSPSSGEESRDEAQVANSGSSGRKRKLIVADDEDEDVTDGADSGNATTNGVQGSGEGVKRMKT